MARPKRTPEEVERDRAEIARLLVRGLTQAEIAFRLETSRQMVSYDVQIIKEAWRKSARFDMEAAIGQELGRLDELEREAWTAWAQSKLPKESTLTGQTTGKAAGNRVEIRREQRDGNPAYLAAIMACIDRRCKLLGLDAPEKVDIEFRIRQVAATLGLDPEAAVAEAYQVIREARRALTAG